MADKYPAGQVTDDENRAASDPNLVGPQATERVRDDRAGKMTPSDEYDQNCAFYGRKYK